jgi:type II secretion system protein N
MRRLVRWVKGLDWKQTAAHVGLFAVLFVVFLYLTFPFDSLTSALVQKIESQGNLRVRIDDLSPFRLTGVKITGLEIRDADNPRKIFVKVDELRARVRPTQLLRRRVWVDFDLYAYNGGVAGSMCRHQGIYDVAVNFANINLSDYETREVVRQYGEFALAGSLSGEAVAGIHPNQRRQNSGSLKVNLDNLHVTGIDLVGNQFPDLAFEPGVVELALNRQNLDIKQFDLKGDHIELKIDGSVSLNQTKLNRSRANITVQFKPSEEFEDALGMIAMALGEPDDDGFYTQRINKRLLPEN